MYTTALYTCVYYTESKAEWSREKLVKVATGVGLVRAGLCCRSIGAAALAINFIGRLLKR